jgi:DNA-binding transcriptional ArsR family regulator
MKYGNGFDASRAVAILAALAHEHRLAVYRLLVEAGPEGRNAGSIAGALGLSPSSLTFHLQHLQRAGLITQARRSRERIYAADFAVMDGLVGYLTENCCSASATCPPERAATRRRAARKAA